VFVLDPTQDAGFRAATGLPAVATPPARQDVVLAEMAARVRHHRGRRSDEPVDVPLVVAMAKADLWARAVGIDLAAEPYRADGIDPDRLRAADRPLRALCERAAPEFMAAMRASFDRALLVPCSALGHEGSATIEPRWAAAPFVAAWQWREGGRLQGFSP
jgi:hypothetical protein